MTRISLRPRGPMGACASSGCGTRRGDCGALCPGVLMQCPGAHTQVPASLPHFLKTPPSRAGSAGLLAVLPGAAFSRGPPWQSPSGTARTPGPTGPRCAGGGSGLCRGPLLRRSCGRLGRFSSSLCPELSDRRGGRKRLRGAAVRTGSGWGRRVRVRVRVRAPSRPGSRQRRQPVRGSSARRGQPVCKVRTNGCF